MNQPTQARVVCLPSAAAITCAILLAVIFSTSAYAQTDPPKPKGRSHTPSSEKNLKPEDIKGGKRPVEFTKADRDEMKSKLLELVDTIQDLSGTISPDDTSTNEAISKVKTQISEFTDEELDSFRASIDPAEMGKGLKQARLTIQDYKPAFKNYYLAMKAHAAGMKAAPEAFPELEGPSAICDALVGSTRPSEALITAADVIYLTAEGVHALASRGCQQVAVAVVLGEGGGGNASLACVVVDVVLALAKAARLKVQSCDDGYTKRGVDAAVRRLEFLHNEAAANVTEVKGAVTNAKTDITTNDNTNKDTILANIESAKTSVVLNANENAGALTTAIGAVQTNVINNDNTNAALLLRTQIEADLQAADNSVPLAMFETPASKGGKLELVRSIVVQTIANLAGAGAAQANSFLAQGDKYRDAGNYKAAYASYRQAYKAAAK